MLCYKLQVLVSLLVSVTCQTSSLVPIVLSGYIDTPYSGTLNSTVQYIYDFSSLSVNSSQPARITLESDDATLDFPVLAVVRQRKGVLSWQLPLIVSTKTNISQYSRTSRILCPGDKNYNPVNFASTNSDSIYVGLSSASLKNLHFTLKLEKENDFMLKLNDEKAFFVSPAEPRYFGFNFDESDTVLLIVKSDDDICMTVSIQDMNCPVFDMERSVEFEGYWETVEKSGGLILSKSEFPDGFYVVFVVKGDNWDCTGSGRLSKTFRNKLLNLSVTPTISHSNYIASTVGALGIFLGFYIFSFTISIIYFIKHRKTNDEHNETGVQNVSVINANETQEEEVDSSNERDLRQDVNNQYDPINNPEQNDTNETPVQEEEQEDSEERTNVRLKVYVVDLAKTEQTVLNRRSRRYLWNLLTVAVFYALPVVQLVINYQVVLKVTGNHDLCYYNFLCAHPLGLLSDFNHVYSNIGYVLLGLLFIFLTYRRDIRYKTLDPQLEKLYGIPQHFGLFYAMGLALTMEGFLSACYHICPNSSNFQFDTSFMYVISLICMLRLYQSRHPDIGGSAYITFCMLALVILIGVVGVFWDSLYFRIFFTIVHISVSLYFSVKIYYMGLWNYDFEKLKLALTETYNNPKQNIVLFFQIKYRHRMVLLILGNMCNWGIAIWGVVVSSSDFPTHLLLIFMANLVLYFSFYIAMKLFKRERILIQPLLYILLSLVSWGAALYYFLSSSTMWRLSPAQSRSYNKTCAIVDFYDTHDIWHFLSAASMFFSFMTLLTLDDDLVTVQRSKILVF